MSTKTEKLLNRRQSRETARLVGGKENLFFAKRRGKNREREREEKNYLLLLGKALRSTIKRSFPRGHLISPEKGKGSQAREAVSRL